MGGIMSLTGSEKGEPYKVGVAIADMMCGMYACTAILSALHHRHKSGEGQYVDIALLDAQVAWLGNSAQNYLTSGELPKRYGNAHPNVVPYEIFPTADGYFSLAVGNDGQFEVFCTLIEKAALAADPRFSTNEQRVVNRELLIPVLRQTLVLQSTSYWLNLFAENGIPAGPVNDVKQIFDDPQILAREMKINMPHADAGKKGIDLIGNPVKFSGTPVSYRRPPPKLGEHTEEVLKEYLHIDQNVLDVYRKQGVI
ncbi:CaiB/BaiF CoA transferase family protein [Pseudomonadota bacterium]